MITGGDNIKGKRKIIIEKQVFIRPVDVAKFIYKKAKKCQEEGKGIDELLDDLAKIIIDMEEEKFQELAEKWGVDP